MPHDNRPDNFMLGEWLLGRVRHCAVLRRFIDRIEDCKNATTHRRGFDHLLGRMDHVIKECQRDSNALSTRKNLQAGPVANSKRPAEPHHPVNSSSSAKPALPGPKKDETSSRALAKSGKGNAAEACDPS